METSKKLMTEKPETIKVWITKHALTAGIIEAEAEVFDQYPNMITVNDGGGRYHYHGNDWHRSQVNAWARACEMRYNKINSLKKKIAKLEVMKFGEE